MDTSDFSRESGSSRSGLLPNTKCEDINKIETSFGDDKDFKYLDTSPYLDNLVSSHDASTSGEFELPGPQIPILEKDSYDDPTPTLSSKTKLEPVSMSSCQLENGVLSPVDPCDRSILSGNTVSPIPCQIDTPNDSDREDYFSGASITTDVSSLGETIMKWVDQCLVPNDVFGNTDGTIKIDEAIMGNAVPVTEIYHRYIRKELNCKIKFRQEMRSKNDEIDIAPRKKCQSPDERKLRNKEHARRSRQRASDQQRSLEKLLMFLVQEFTQLSTLIQELQGELQTLQSWLNTHASSCNMNMANVSSGNTFDVVGVKHPCGQRARLGKEKLHSISNKYKYKPKLSLCLELVSGDETRRPVCEKRSCTQSISLSPLITPMSALKLNPSPGPESDDADYVVKQSPWQVERFKD